MPVPRAIYLVRAENGLCKIGISSSPYRRFGDLCNYSPIPLELAYLARPDDAATLEAELHQRFASKRSHGEWFALAAADVAYVMGLYPNEVAAPSLDPYERAVGLARVTALQAHEAVTLYRLPDDPPDVFRHDVWANLPQRFVRIAIVTRTGGAHPCGPKQKQGARYAANA